MIQVLRPHERPRAFHTFDGMFRELDRPQHHG